MLKIVLELNMIKSVLHYLLSWNSLLEKIGCLYNNFNSRLYNKDEYNQFSNWFIFILNIDNHWVNYWSLFVVLSTICNHKTYHFAWYQIDVTSSIYFLKGSIMLCCFEKNHEIIEFLIESIFKFKSSTLSYCMNARLLLKDLSDSNL